MVLGQVKLATPMHLRNAAPPSQKISLPSDAHRRSSRKMAQQKRRRGARRRQLAKLLESDLSSEFRSADTSLHTDLVRTSSGLGRSAEQHFQNVHFAIWLSPCLLCRHSHPSPITSCKRQRRKAWRRASAASRSRMSRCPPRRLTRLSMPSHRSSTAHPSRSTRPLSAAMPMSSSRNSSRLAAPHSSRSPRAPPRPPRQASPTRLRTRTSAAAHSRHSFQTCRHHATQPARRAQLFGGSLQRNPTEAHDILIAEGILDLVLEAPDACNAVRRPTSDSASSDVPSPPLQLRDDQLVSLALAELVSSAANSTVTRKFLAGQQALLDWLDIACVPRNTSSSAPALDSQPKSNAVAILSGLADIKIYRATASESVQGLSQSLSSQQTSQQDHIRKIKQDRSERQRKDHSLFDAIRVELLSRTPGSEPSQKLESLDQVARAELDRSIQLGCLEALAYLTVQPVFKDRLAAEPRLLTILCTTFHPTAPKHTGITKTVDADSQRFDGAFQLGLATILSNLTAYPKTLTAEEKQIRRLRKFANAQETKQNDATSADNGDGDDDDELETVEHADKRCAAVLDARGIEALCSLALAGRPSPNSTSAGLKVNPSKSVRTACSDALLALLTKQDRTVRGKAVQQGALKAVLALSAPVLHDLLPAPSTDAEAEQSSANRTGLFSRGAKSSTPSVTSHDLAPLQALAKLLISLNPSILFPSEQGLLSVTSLICSLLLAPAASQLQKFEALLALTNLASLSPQICLNVAAFSLETATRDRVTNDSSIAFSTSSVLAHACEQLLMEDHAMLRRAWIELLVNCSRFRKFSRTLSPLPGSHEQQSRLTLRLRTSSVCPR